MFKLMIGILSASSEGFPAQAVMVGVFQQDVGSYSHGCVTSCSILQAVEAKQMQDEMAGITGKPLKAKGGKQGGKQKVTKAQLTEVMPSPHGIRVVPQITAEMKAEAEKRTKRKIKVRGAQMLQTLLFHPLQHSPVEAPSC